MNRGAIVQTRMTLTKLPGKVLMDLEGTPMLVQQMWRLKRSASLDEIVGPTTTNHTDEPVVAVIKSEDVGWFLGGEDNVLWRYVGAARETDSIVVVRNTLDCPRIDPRSVDEPVKHDGKCDYGANCLQRSYPRGLDAKAFFIDVLARMNRFGRSAAACEHMTHFLFDERRDLFVVRLVKDTEDNWDLRRTIDTADDFTMVCRFNADLRLGDHVGRTATSSRMPRSRA
jgi:spore coat polysaccharide biosynthesis protein SpsF